MVPYLFDGWKSNKVANQGGIYRFNHPSFHHSVLCPPPSEHRVIWLWKVDNDVS